MGTVPFRDLRPDVEHTECMRNLIDYMLIMPGFEMIIFTERNRRLTEQHVHLFLYYDVRCSQMNTIWRMAWKP